MDATRWHKLEALFEEARELPPEEQSAFLERACDEETLRGELEALLSVEEEASSYFDRLAGSVLPSGLQQMEAPEPEDLRSSPDALVGQSVANYQIIEKLGGGGMGVVYKAWHDRLGRCAALKFLPLPFSADAEAKERFFNEARAAAMLDHPNLCTIYDIGEAKDDRLFIAMAYYEGETLKKKIAQGQLPMGAALGYAVQIARGLAKAHAAGIVHRDIKPANVMVAEDGNIKIVDFGLARLEGSPHLARPDARMGTTAYMSPEQVRGEAVDRRTDLWSLGVVIYEMLTGRRPFQGTSERAVLHAILNEEPTPPSTLRPALPEELEHLIHQMLVKDREQRLSSAEDMLGQLSSFWTEKGMPGLLPFRASSS